MDTILLKSVIAGIIFALTNASFDYASKLKLSKETGNLLSILIISLIIVIPMSYVVYTFGISLNVFLAVIGIYFVLLLAGGFTNGIYTWGIKNGEKYWRNHVEKFYAYGIGVIISVSISIYVIIGNAYCKPSDEFSQSPDWNFADLILMSFNFSAFLLPSYWLGVFIQNQRKIKEQKENLHTNSK